VDKTEQGQRLAAERELYERTKRELNQKLRDIKEIHDKENQDASLRFNSLQQQYKILKTQQQDIEQHCETAKKQLATENDGLKSQLAKFQGQLTKTKSSNENDLTMWKVINMMITKLTFI
jgi:DNA-binding transcriptional MerR regulator